MLGIPNAKKLIYYPRRTNLHLQSRDYDTDVNIADVLKHEIDGPTIVYCSTVDRTEKTAATLSNLLSEEVTFFHGQLPDSVRRNNMDVFMSDKVRIVVATNAFGMGVDKSNVRGVIHRDIPGCIEALAQEVGRAGRDGKDSLCVTFMSDASLRTQRFFIECSNPTPAEIRHVFNTLRNSSDAAGNVQLTMRDISTQSKVLSWKIGSVMEILKANKVIERTEREQKIFKIRLSTPDALTHDKRLQTWWGILETIGVRVDGGFLEVDYDSFVASTGLSAATVSSWIRKWQSEDLIRYVAPFAGAPTKIIGNINGIDFKRLDRKLEAANEKLNKVLEYVNIPDQDKHAFLEEYFGVGSYG